MSKWLIFSTDWEILQAVDAATAGQVLSLYGEFGRAGKMQPAIEIIGPLLPETAEQMMNAIAVHRHGVIDAAVAVVRKKGSISQLRRSLRDAGML